MSGLEARHLEAPKKDGVGTLNLDRLILLPVLPRPFGQRY
jgi:hypothetical protein